MVILGAIDRVNGCAQVHPVDGDRRHRLTMLVRSAGLRRVEKALRRFRKSTNAVGHLRILRNRKTFENAHDKKIRKTKESSMRQARARRSARSRAMSGF